MDHEFYMQQALALAQEAAVHGEVPVGCVIVRDGQIIASGRNQREEKQAAVSSRGDGGHRPGQCGAGQLAAGRVRPVCDAGALPHVRWGHS